jgi:uncharacterized membrane protein YobD (UPF0266 family)
VLFEVSKCQFFYAVVFLDWEKFSIVELSIDSVAVG